MDKDLKEKIEIIDNPQNMLMQITTKLGNTQALQTAAKVRLASMPSPGS